MKEFVCSICGYVYSEAKGIPEKGITPGTKWEDLPANWRCPLCAAPKSEFKEKVMVSETTPTVSLPVLDFEQELSPMEMSVICSNLAQGCEKQYMPKEAENFRILADFFKSKAQPIPEGREKELLELIEKDLEIGYPHSNALGKENKDRGALRTLTWSEKVARIQKSLLNRYQTEGDKMLENTNVYVCSVCGFISIDTAPPELCPVCKVPAWKFDKMEGGAF